MDKVDKILQKLEGLENRIGLLENSNSNQERKKQTVGNFPDLTPNDVPQGYMAFAGNYEGDGLGSHFGDNALEIAKLFKANPFELSQVIDAFSSEERIKIVIELIQQKLTAKQLMERLNFTTTGKLYHHLSFLEKIGVINKSGELYWVSSRYISCVLLILAGTERIVRKNNRYNEQ